VLVAHKGRSREGPALGFGGAPGAAAALSRTVARGPTGANLERVFAEHYAARSLLFAAAEPAFAVLRDPTRKLVFTAALEIGAALLVPRQTRLECAQIPGFQVPRIGEIVDGAPPEMCRERVFSVSLVSDSTAEGCRFPYVSRQYDASSAFPQEVASGSMWHTVDVVSPCTEAVERYPHPSLHVSVD
jgi:hypothetical protein